MAYDDNQSSGGALVPVNDKALAIIREMEGPNFNEAVARQHFMMTTDKNGNPQIYVKKAGLLRKMEQKYGENWTPQVQLPTREERELLLEMLGLTPADKYVIMKGAIYIQGKEIPIVDFGTVDPVASPKNKRFIELAGTRAVSRAMRLATNCGFTAVEEMDEKLTADEIAEEKKAESPVPVDKIDKVKAKYQERLAEAGYDANNSKVRMAYIKKVFPNRDPFKKPLTAEEWDKIIGTLEAEIDEKRNAAEAAAADVEEEAQEKTPPAKQSGEEIVDAEIVEKKTETDTPPAPPENAPAVGSSVAAEQGQLLLPDAA